MGHIISVVSGKGGVGKTTLSVALARHLTAMGKSALLVDTDWGMCSAGYLLESGSRVLYTLQDVLENAASFEQAIVEEQECPAFLATANRPLAPHQIPQLADLLHQAAESYDFVVIDRPAGLDFSLEQVLGDVFPLIVCGFDPMSAHGAHAANEQLRQTGCPSGRLVVNRFVPAMVQKKIAADLDALCDRVGVGLLGVVPMDERVLTDGLTGRFHTTAPYNKAVARIARRLTRESVPLPKLKKLSK